MNIERRDRSITLYTVRLGNREVNSTNIPIHEYCSCHHPISQFPTTNYIIVNAILVVVSFSTNHGMFPEYVYLNKAALPVGMQRKIGGIQDNR